MKYVSWMLMGCLWMAAGCAGAGEEVKPEPPVYVEADKEPEPEPQPPVVPVPVAQPAPGQLRPAPPMKKPTGEDVAEAKKKARGKKPHEIIDEANASAAASPAPDGYYNAMMTYDYTPGVLYQVYTAPLKITAISFAPGEKVSSVGMGDTTRWIVGRTASGQGDRRREIVLIKPVRAWLDTTMTVTTNRRVYHLELHSYEESYMAAVRWNYPHDLVRRYAVQQQKQKTSEGPPSKEGRSTEFGGPTVGASVDRLNFDYGFVVEDKERLPSWMPRRVFDDGQKTYIQFPSKVAEKEAPALFMLSQEGKAQIINYRVRGDYYVVDGTFDLAQLRMGEKDPVTVGIERSPDDK